MKLFCMCLLLMIEVVYVENTQCFTCSPCNITADLITCDGGKEWSGGQMWCFKRKWAARGQYKKFEQRGCYRMPIAASSLTDMVPQCRHIRGPEAEIIMCLCNGDRCNIASNPAMQPTIIYVCLLTSIFRYLSIVD